MTLTVLPRVVHTTATLAESSSTILLDDMPAGDHIIIETSLAATEAGCRANITFNADTTSNYQTAVLTATDTTLAHAKGALAASIVGPYAPNDGGAAYAAGVIAIPWAFTTDRLQLAIMELGNLATAMNRSTGVRFSTEAVTSVTLTASAGQFTAGSSVRVYAVPAASVVASVNNETAGNWSFTSLDHRHLVLLGSGRSTITEADAGSYATTHYGDRVYYSINGNTTAADYPMQRLTGEDPSTLALGSFNERRIVWVPNEEATASSFGAMVALFQEANNTGFQRTQFVQHGAYEQRWFPAANENGRFASTAAINSLSFSPRGGATGVAATFTAGSKAALLELAAGTRHVVGSGGAASVTLDVPAGSTSVTVLVTARSNASQDDDRAMVSINGSTTGFNRQRSTALSGAGEAARAADGEFGVIPAGTAAANVFSSGLISVMWPSSTDRHKQILSSLGASSGRIGLYAGTWGNTSAVTSVTLTPKDGSFVEGSVFELIASGAPVVGAISVPAGALTAAAGGTLTAA